MKTKPAFARIPATAHTNEIYGKIVCFNPKNGIGVIKEHRTDKRFQFHASSQLCAEMKNGAPTLTLKKRRRIEKIHRGMGVVFFAEDEEVTGFSPVRDFHNLEKRASSVEFAKVTLGRRSFKTPAWKARQMLRRWGNNGSSDQVIEARFFRRRNYSVAA